MKALVLPATANINLVNAVPISNPATVTMSASVKAATANMPPASATATLMRCVPAIKFAMQPVPAVVNVPAAMFRVPAVLAETLPAAAAAVAVVAGTKAMIAQASVTYFQVIVNYRACLKIGFQAGSFFSKEQIKMISFEDEQQSGFKNF